MKNYSANIFHIPTLFISLAISLMMQTHIAQAQLSNKALSRADFASILDKKNYQSFIVHYQALSSMRAGDRMVIQQRLDEISSAFGMELTLARSLSTGGVLVYTKKPLDAQDAKLLFQIFLQQQDLDFIEPDRDIWPLLTPNDPRYIDQWHYYEPLAGINLPAAWNNVTGAGVTVAVLDTGITSHPDLAANVVGGYDFIHVPDSSLFFDFVDPRDGDGPDNDPSDEGDWYRSGVDCQRPADFLPPAVPNNGQFIASSWHGTHVAGTIAALTNNGLGVAGVAHGASIVPVRVLGKCGGRLFELAMGIRWAAGLLVHDDAGNPLPNPYPAQVLNLSVGTGAPGPCLAKSLLQRAINSARSQGVVVVVAAGNSSNLANYPPANCQGVITVAATDRQGNLAAYSNFGPNITVSAPGGEAFNGMFNGVLSTHNSGITGPATPSYTFMSGTSMATPHVSGLVALMLEANPSLTPDQVSTLLQNNARPLPGVCIVNCGAGIVDAAATINAVLSPPAPDAYEEDDTAFQWSAYTGTPQQHNFADDTVDWVATWNSGNNRRVYETLNLGTNADTCLSVYSVNSDGSPLALLARDCDSGGGGKSRVVLDQPTGGYLVKIENETGLSGAFTEYTFRVTSTPISVAADTFEQDDTASQWSAYAGVPQQHNFADDTVDWVASWNSGMNRRVYETFNLGPYADTCITVYSVNSNNGPATILAHDCDSGGNGRSRIVLDQPPGGYLIKIENESGTKGVGTDYTFRITNQPL